MKFYHTHLEITLEKSKTDIYRQGNVVIIAKTGTDLCPVTILKRYLQKADISLCSEDFIFRSLVFHKLNNNYTHSKQNKSISYTRAREIVLNALQEIGLDKTKFGLHSLRSGGVTSAASNSVPDRLLKAHGRWKSEKAKDGYIKESVTNKLFSTQHSGL